MTSVKVPHEWSKDSLLNKAQRYAEKMLEQDRDDWQFGFWSVLTLEMLIKAAISNVSPTLLAEKDWKNTYFALGYAHPDGKPKTSKMNELLKIAKVILPGFNPDMQNFCSTHVERRNSEVHSGAMPFDDLQSSVWLGDFYSTCNFLLKSVKKNLPFLFGKDEAKAARILMKGMEEKTSKTVKKKIEQFRKDWHQKPKASREVLAKNATQYATRNLGHRVKCPSCKSDALVKGSPTGLPKVSLHDDLVIVKTPMLPTNFECSACQLKITGYARLNACGLGGVYTSKTSHDAVEYYGPQYEEQWAGYEEDNNEP